MLSFPQILAICDNFVGTRVGMPSLTSAFWCDLWGRCEWSANVGGCESFGGGQSWGFIGWQLLIR